MFPLPRIMYAMSVDGLIFKFFSNIHERFKTPLLATFAAGLFAGAMAMMFNIKELANMMSIGTLLAYTLVAISVLILRYRLEHDRRATSLIPHASGTQLSSIMEMSESSSTSNYTKSEIWVQIFNCDRVRDQTQLSSSISMYLIYTTGGLLFILDVLLISLENKLGALDVAALASVCVIFVLVCIVVAALARQPSDQQELSFKVPWVPYVPVISVFVNIYLMAKLPINTWYRFAIWMAIGFVIYFAYGMWHSKERVGFALPPPPALEMPSAMPTIMEADLKNKPKSDMKREPLSDLGKEPKSDLEKKPKYLLEKEPPESDLEKEPKND